MNEKIYLIKEQTGELKTGVIQRIMGEISDIESDLRRLSKYPDQLHDIIPEMAREISFIDNDIKLLYSQIQELDEKVDEYIRVEREK